jgi:Domain of Unknown Function (DUF1080)
MRSLLCLLLPAVLSFAVAVDTPATFRTVPGKALVDESFAVPSLPTAWSAAKGTWTVVDGALEGREKPEDEHNAVFVSKQTIPATFVLKADLRFDGATAMALLFNGPGGHVCRATFTPKGFTVTGDKDKKDEADKAAVLGKVEQTFAPGQWFTVTIEVTGDEMLVWTDPAHAVYGRHAKIARAKNAVGISLAKVSGRIDNIRLLEATDDQAWEQKKAQLTLSEQATKAK